MNVHPIILAQLRVAIRAEKRFRRQLGVPVVLGVLILLTANPWFTTPLATMRGWHLSVGAFWIFIYLLATTPALGADQVAQEKRDGTLGLLFLTHATGFDIALGKGLAVWVRAFLPWLAVLPFGMLLVLGGLLTFGQLAILLLAVAETLLVGIACGLVASGYCTRRRRAITLSAGMFLCLLIGPLVMGSLVTAWGNVFGIACVLLSPTTLFFSPLAPAATGVPILVCAVGPLFLSTVLFAWAGRAARTRWQLKPDSKTRYTLKERWRHLRQGKAAIRLIRRKRYLDESAICWLALRDRWQSVPIWACLAGGGVGWWWICQLTTTVEERALVAVAFLFLLKILFKAQFAGLAAQPLFEQRRTGALEFLFATPLTVEDWVRGQFRALRHLVLGPLITLLVLDLAGLGALAWSQTEGRGPTMLDRDMATALGCFWAGTTLLLFADLPALAWSSLWGAVKEKEFRKVGSHGFNGVLIARWFVTGMLWAVFAMSGLAVQFPLPGLYWFMGIWLGAGLLQNLLQRAHAKRKVFNNIRRAATTH